MKQTRATAVGGGSAGSAGKERSKPRRNVLLPAECPMERFAPKPRNG